MAVIKSGDPPEKARKNAAIPKKIDFPCFLSCSKKPWRRKERFYFASRSKATMQGEQMGDCVFFCTERENSFACAGPATQLQKGMHVDFPKKKQPIQENAQRSDALLIPKQRLQTLDRDQKWSEQSEIGEEWFADARNARSRESVKQRPDAEAARRVRPRDGAEKGARRARPRCCAASVDMPMQQGAQPSESLNALTLRQREESGRATVQ